MTRTVTTSYRYKRPLRKKVKTEASGHVQRMRLVAIVAVGALLAGCAADTRPSDQELARNGRTGR